MAEKIDFGNGRIFNFQRHVTLTLDWAIYGTPSCITHRPLPTHQISFKLEKVFVDGCTYVRTWLTYVCTTYIHRHKDGRTDRQTSRPTKSRSWPNKWRQSGSFLLRHRVPTHDKTNKELCKEDCKWKKNDSKQTNDCQLRDTHAR